jgi:hypothetical protein
MKIQKFNSFLNEDLSDYQNKLSDENKDLKVEILEMVKKSVNSEDEKVFMEFIDSFIETPGDNKIEGLINGSDIQDFYKKFSNQIDEMLSEINFYDESPSDMDCFSLYDYVNKGTMKAVESLMKDIKSEITGESSEETT